VKVFLRQNRQLLLYCVIGASGALVDFSVYSLLVRSGTVGYQAANALGYASGTVLSFILNAKYNFRVADKIGLRLASFCGVALLGYVVSAAALQLFIGRLSFDKYLAKLVTLFVVVLLQYNLNRLISFRKAS
jgi:putative flippase GtrA